MGVLPALFEGRERIALGCQGEGIRFAKVGQKEELQFPCSPGHLTPGRLKRCDDTKGKAGYLVLMAVPWQECVS